MWPVFKDKQKDFERGFCWVMTDFYIHHKPLQEMYAYIEGATLSGNKTDFDKGAEEALRIISLDNYP